MGGLSLRRRLSTDRQLLGRRVAADAFEGCDGDRAKYLELARADARLKGFGPAEILLIMQLVKLLYDWWVSRQVTHPTRETEFSLPDAADDEIDDQWLESELVTQAVHSDAQTDSPADTDTEVDGDE